MSTSISKSDLFFEVYFIVNSNLAMNPISFYVFIFASTLILHNSFLDFFFKAIRTNNESEKNYDIFCFLSLMMLRVSSIKKKSLSSENRATLWRAPFL